VDGHEICLDVAAGGDIGGRSRVGAGSCESAGQSAAE
jgi:hypothetical protein